jgi:hypothetical protein
VILPGPRKVRATRVILVVITVVLVGLGIASVGVTLRNPTLSWPGRLLFLAFFAAAALGIWYTFRPPVLKADAMYVTYNDRINRQQMARSELSFVFRGQVSERSRLGDVWGKGYIFARSDGRIAVTLHTYWFSDDRIAEFAQRLQVPVRGDFTERVRDRVDPTLT